MASKIKVDQLETADGSGTIALQNQLSGMTSASMPTGSTLQVLSHHHTSGSNVNTTSTSYVATGLTKTITPSATSSKIKIDISFYADVDTTGAAAFFTIKRGSDSLGGATRNAGTGLALVANGRLLTGLSITYLDSPSTTSATTYSLHMKADGGTVRYRPDEAVCALILTEIKG